MKEKSLLISIMQTHLLGADRTGAQDAIETLIIRELEARNQKIWKWKL
jgi:hypothetical protein